MLARGTVFLYRISEHMQWMIVEFRRSAMTCGITYVAGNPAVSIVHVLSHRSVPDEILVRSQSSPTGTEVSRVLPLSSQHHSNTGALITVQLPSAVYNINN